MAKDKVKKRSRKNVVDATLIALTSRLDAADHAIDALDEAICPRVAARLTALERIAEQFKADDHAKALAIRELGVFARRFAGLEQQVQELAKTVTRRAYAEAPTKQTPTTNYRAYTYGGDPGYIERVAIKLNEVSGIGIPWEQIPEEAKVALCEKCRRIIEIVQTVK